MATRLPFRRGRSTTSAAPSEDSSEQPKLRESAWDARRRRREKQGQASKNNRRNQDLPEEEYDPYDSDPGESYRDHCERLKGDRTRSCLTFPRFLQNKVDAVTVTDSTLIPPPEDEFDTSYKPPSLPRDLARARYSLRSRIGDGSMVQPVAMDLRDLRPNSVHINVSHWSAFGGRDYMEDR
jgi:hypothetical protein